MSNFNLSGDPGGDNKFSQFMSGRGVYLLLAVCLVGSGIAAWSAISGSFFTEGGDPPTIESSPDDNWGFPLLEDVERTDPDQPLPSSQPPASSQQPAASSEQDAFIESSDEQPEPPTSVFVLPLDGTILQDYSDGELVKNETLSEWRTHNGVDIAAEEGSEVYAVTGGTVLDVRTDALWGFVVEIEHDNGLVSIYAGLENDIRVSRGDTVGTRDVIGTVGTMPIELHHGSHLHFEVKVDGVYVDPLVAIGKK